MSQLYNAFVRALYIISWPATALCLHNSRRARVLVKNGNKILLVKSAYGSRRWELPGGGVKRGEASKKAVQRELAEEAGLSVHEKNLEYLARERISNNRIGFPRMNVDIFQTTCADEPRIVRAHEIIGLKWFAVTKLPSNKTACVDVALKHAK